ncbi:unnamed protein product [Merluccius merluccius]
MWCSPQTRNLTRRFVEWQSISTGAAECFCEVRGVAGSTRHGETDGERSPFFCPACSQPERGTLRRLWFP